MEGKKVIEVFSESSYTYDDGSVGWATIVTHDGDEVVVYGGKENLSKYRSELIGIVYALYYIKTEDLKFDIIDILSDESYIVKGINEYVYTWITKGEIKPNMDCWNIIWKYIQKYNRGRKKQLRANYKYGSHELGIEKSLYYKSKRDKTLKRLDNYIK